MVRSPYLRSLYDDWKVHESLGSAVKLYCRTLGLYLAVATSRCFDTHVSTQARLRLRFDAGYGHLFDILGCHHRVIRRFERTVYNVVDHSRLHTID